MVPKAGYFTPLLHVMDVRRSIRFYQLLGFELIDLEGDPACPGWARMHCEGGAVMFLLAEKPFDPDKHALLTAMYTPDLPAFREHLLANGIAAPPITYPGYMPSGSLSLRDPDGYIVDIHHWSDAEHQAWLKDVEEKKKSGALPSSP
jgi:catechol 2,3-dioxygenase-like lactoylglutathione lyase family enzyme